MVVLISNDPSYGTAGFPLEDKHRLGVAIKRYAILIASLLSVFFVTAGKSGPTVDDAIPSNAVPSSKVMYK